jgi:hypothetical protein
MSIHFEAARGSAVDRQNDLTIYQPRMQPTDTADEVEYEYAIYRGDVRYGLWCLGTSHLTQVEGRVVRIFTLDLGRDWVSKSFWELKKEISISGDDLNFLVGLAEGLVKVFQSRTDNDAEVRYVALSQELALQDRGIVAPKNLARLPNGSLILAEVVVPAHPLPSATQ